MNIAIVNPFDPLPWESKRRARYSMLANELVDRGHRVSWITADFFHGNKQYRQQPTTNENIEIQVLFIKVPPYYKNISPQRIISHHAYATGVSQALKSLNESDQIDLVIASIPPTSSARAAMEFCSETGIIGIIDMQDAWPKAIESIFPSFLRNLLSKILLRSLAEDVKLAVKLADGLVGVSPDFIDYLLGFQDTPKPIEKALLPLGFDTQFFQISELLSKDLNLPLVVSYIGNFSYFYDLETVVRAAKECENKPIKFNLIGDGSTYDQIKHLANKLSLTNINFTGQLPFEMALSILLESDIGLLPYTSDWPPNMPNKVFDYLFLGLPVISSITGYFKETLDEYKFGSHYEAGSVESLTAKLLDFYERRELLPQMGRSGLEYARKNMDGKIIYQQYADFLENFTIAIQTH